MYLCDQSVMQTFEKGEQFIIEKQEDQSLFFLKKGAIKLIKAKASEPNYVDTIMNQGALFGISKMLLDEPEDEHIICIRRSKVCKVPIEILEELMEKNDALHNYILKLAGLKIKRLQHRLENLIFKSSEERIREFIPNYIKEFGVDKGPFFEAELILTNKDIGQLTNTTRQKVNEIMNQMKKRGEIMYDKKSIKWFK